MPPFPGEETLATVYADIHSYFTAPSPRPALHRFDKASYFYVYYNSTRQTCRVEAAINAGTPDQTAFNGFLDNVKVTHSHKFPTRLTLTVDGDHAQSTSPTSARSARDPDEWRLASSDPRDPGTSKFRMHTVDLYFWSQDDSKLMVDIFKRLLQPHQLDLDEIQEESHHQDMVSPVVQNLEHLAVSDPAYKQRQQDRNQLSPAPPVAAAHSSGYGQAASPSPPSVAGVGGRSSANPAQATNFTPLAYNPAAPAAPEPIAHREDTPPPIDANEGTGLAAAAKHDHFVPQQQHQAYGGPPSAQVGTYPGHYGSPPPPSFGPNATTSPVPSFGPQAAATVPHSLGPYAASTPVPTSPRTSVSTNFAPPPTSAGSDNSRHPSIAAQSYVPHGGQGEDPNSHIFGHQSVQTPGSQFYQSINGQPHKALAHVQPQYPDYLSAGQPPPSAAAAPPVGGYSGYNYAQTQQPQPNPPAGYDVHSHVYRPTEGEHQTKHHSKPSKSSGSQHKPSTGEKVEKGIGKWIKKVEKNFG